MKPATPARAPTPDPTPDPTPAPTFAPARSLPASAGAVVAALTGLALAGAPGMAAAQGVQGAMVAPLPPCDPARDGRPCQEQMLTQALRDAADALLRQARPAGTDLPDAILARARQQIPDVVCALGLDAADLRRRAEAALRDAIRG